MSDVEDDEVVKATKRAKLRRALIKFALGLGVGAAALFVGLTVGGMLEEHWLRGRVMPHVVVLGTDYSGLRPEQVHAGLLVAKAQVLNRHCRIVVKGQQFEVTPGRAGFDFDVAKVEQKVMQSGRTGSWWSRWRWRFRRLFYPQIIDVEPQFGAIQLEPLRKDWSTAIDNPPVEARIEYEQGVVKGVRPRVGSIIDTAAFIDAWGTALTSSSSTDLLRVEAPLSSYQPKVSVNALAIAQNRGQVMTQAPITLAYDDMRWVISRDALGKALRSTPKPPDELEVTLDPAEIDRALIEPRAELERAAVDAHFLIDAQQRVTLAPSLPAKRIATNDVITALWIAADTPQRTLTVPLHEVQEAQLTTAQAQALGITQHVSGFTTHYVCCQPRVKNIHRMADLLNDTVLVPFEILSVNGKVGERTQKRGFVAGPTIVEGEMEDTFGGGVSQFATTLFNAVLEGGYQLLERQAHSYYFNRYPLGHDATLSFPKPDLIFKNDTQYGLLIKASYTETSIRIDLYGNNEGRKVQRKVSAAFDFKDPPVDYLADDQLKPDEEKVKEAGSRGFSVIATRIITKADGTRTQEARKVVYNPRQRVVAVHPCMIPKEDSDHTGEECPKPEEAQAAPAGTGGAPNASQLGAVPPKSEH
ncbi:MAG TPA: VanW family protein [Polyangiaceae bacterium]|nr:VanW family protein [Polyangiaceae bacterium]